MTTNTALQVTNFNFYGDDLIALRDNSTGEIYAAINHVLINIGFTERQTKHIHKKWSEDLIISKGVQNFVLPTKNGNQETRCISNRKLPIALTKISITPKMKQTQPELASKLELYQDKCADVLASVFIDRKDPNNIDMTPLISSITSLSAQMITLTNEMTKLKESRNKPKPLPANKFSRWKTKVFEQMKSIQSYVNDNSDQELTLPLTMKVIFDELQDTYNIDLSEYTEMYKGSDIRYNQPL